MVHNVSELSACLQVREKQAARLANMLTINTLPGPTTVGKELGEKGQTDFLILLGRDGSSVYERIPSSCQWSQTVRRCTKRSSTRRDSEPHTYSTVCWQPDTS